MSIPVFRCFIPTAVYNMQQDAFKKELKARPQHPSIQYSTDNLLRGKKPPQHYNKAGYCVTVDSNGEHEHKHRGQCIVYITDGSDGRGGVHAPGRLKLDVSIFSNLVMKISGGFTVTGRDVRIAGRSRCAFWRSDTLPVVLFWFIPGQLMTCVKLPAFFPFASAMRRVWFSFTALCCTVHLPSIIPTDASRKCARNSSLSLIFQSFRCCNVTLEPCKDTGQSQVWVFSLRKALRLLLYSGVLQTELKKNTAHSALYLHVHSLYFHVHATLFFICMFIPVLLGGMQLLPLCNQCY